MSAATMSVPSLAMAMATDRPMPPAAPVITAVLPANSTSSPYGFADALQKEKGH
jgi:hypothetical protein